MKTQRRSSGTYAENLARLSEARKILTGLGFRTQGRVETYEANLRKLAEAMPNRIEAEFTEASASEAILMFAEISEFHFVVDALPKCPFLLRHPRFKEIISGQALTTSEQNTAPRNTLFELNIAALLGLADFPVSLEDVADVETVFQNAPMLIECKRIQTFDKLEARISEAHHQLEPRLTARGKGAVGVVALSISKALTGGDKRLNTADTEKMNAAMTELLKMGQNNLAPFWERYSSFDGVLVHLCVSGRTSGPFVNTQYAMLARHNLSEARSKLLQDFMGWLQAVHLPE